jgi:hypothetical protein
MALNVRNVPSDIDGKPHAVSTVPAKSTHRPETSGEDAHEGATEDQVQDVTPPAGPAFEDEPKQG